MTRPRASVVIPTWKRETRLAFTLEGLADQTIDPSEFEVLVVRAAAGLDGPLIDAPEGLEVRFLVSGKAGAAAQRNVGWRAANAPLVAFLDDDCRPSREWLASLMDAEADGFFLQGRTSPDPDETHLLGGLARSLWVDAAGGWYPTCNVAFRRDLLERLAGFDEIFPGAFGEDTDLALRAIGSGVRPKFVPGAVVWHAVHARTLRTALREARRNEVIPLVVKRHPAQRRELILGLFFNWRHARLSLAFAGSAVFRGYPLLAAASWIPYVIPNVQWRGSPSRLARTVLALPGRVIADAAEVASVVRGAIRHREPVV